MSLLLANVVLVLHVALATFVVGGLLFVIVGNALRWRLANNLWLRLAHLAAILVVVAEAWLGMTCPLTSMEMALRARAGLGAYSGGFIEHWLHRLLYYEAPPWAFVIAYSAFGLAVAATWWFFPPRFKAGTGARMA